MATYAAPFNSEPVVPVNLDAATVLAALPVSTTDLYDFTDPHEAGVFPPNDTRQPWQVTHAVVEAEVGGQSRGTGTVYWCRSTTDALLVAAAARVLGATVGTLIVDAPQETAPYAVLTTIPFGPR